MGLVTANIELVNAGEIFFAWFQRKARGTLSIKLNPTYSGLIGTKSGIRPSISSSTKVF